MFTVHIVETKIESRKQCFFIVKIAYLCLIKNITIDQQFRIELTSVKSTVGQLKNGVGDLKAEWMLIKRQVQDIKSENTQLKFGQNGLKEDTLQLKVRPSGLMITGGVHVCSE